MRGALLLFAVSTAALRVAHWLPRSVHTCIFHLAPRR